MTTLRLFLRCALLRATALRALSVATAITPILAVINHGNELLAGRFNGALLVQIGLTFCVPYCVSTYSSARAEMAHERRPKPARSGVVRRQCHARRGLRWAYSLFIAWAGWGMGKKGLRGRPGPRGGDFALTAAAPGQPARVLIGLTQREDSMIAVHRPMVLGGLERLNWLFGLVPGAGWRLWVASAFQWAEDRQEQMPNERLVEQQRLLRQAEMDCDRVIARYFIGS